MRADRKQNGSNRILAFVLAMVLMVSFVLDHANIAIAADDIGDFHISLSWNKNEDPYNLVYDSGSPETRLVRMKIAYSNKVVSKEFKPGDLTITVTGLKDAVRSGGSYMPVGVAADKQPIALNDCEYDWSYTYTAATDTYTFTNNNEIKEKSTFEGSFEMIWKLPSRDTKDNFTKEISANLYTPDVSVQSNTITYSQSREPDRYTITQQTSKLYKDTLPLASHNDYIWVNYDIGATDVHYAKDVEGDEKFVCYFLADAIVKSKELTATDETVTIDGKDYKKYYAYKNVTDHNGPYYLENVLVAYPRSEYDESSKVINYVDLYGTYYESDPSDYINGEVIDGEGLLAKFQETTSLADYDFADIPGVVYNVWKSSYGVHSQFIDSHCDECMRCGAVNSVHLANGEGTYYSTLKVRLYFYNSAIPHPESYDLEFVDDVIEVEMQDGSIRRLGDDEFHFTKIYIPPVSDIRNNNGFTIAPDAYDVEIYVRKSGAPASEFERLNTDQTNGLKISTGAQMIDVPADTVGVKIKVVDVKEGFETDAFRCYYQFHTDDTNIATNGGLVFNNMYFKLNGTYSDNEGNYYNDAVLNDYSTVTDPEELVAILTTLYGADYENNREYQRDMALYGEPLDREVGKTHILEIPNEFKMTEVKLGPDTSINEQGLSKLAYHLLGDIKSEFVLGEGTELSNFSIYTIVPEDLRLEEMYNDPEALKDVLTFSADGYSQAEIASHVKITIVDDPDFYDGRQYIKFEFDFSDDPVTMDNLSISGIPMYVMRHDVPYGDVSYTMHAAVLVDQAGKWYSNGTDGNLMENFVWADIDGDGDNEEPASFASWTYHFANSENYEMVLTKRVSTPYSKGPDNPGKDAPIDEVPMTDEGGNYSYFLCAKVNTGVAKDIVFVDVIEPDGISEWQGEFVGIDYSGVVSQLTYENNVIIPPTIYYSDQEESADSYTITDATGHVTINRDAFKTGNWTTTKPKVVRSIAVDFGEGKAKNIDGSEMMLEVKMKAPTDPENYNTRALNSCCIGYNWIQKLDETKTYPDYLTSNTVPVRYMPKGKIILTKRDETSGKVITGATFELYKKGDGDGAPDELVGTYETNANGRITAGNLMYGIYYFKETNAPKGYELSETVSDDVMLSADSAERSIVFCNTRKKGSFTLKKVSDRLPDRALQGAEFMLYKEDGTAVSDTPFVTDENGTLKVSSLEWGKYYLLETKAPAGYEIASEKIEFEINADTVEAPQSVTVSNKQKPATAVLEKYELQDKYGTFAHDANGNINVALLDETAPIGGAVYELYDAAGTKLSANVTTADGKIYAEDLTFGKYYFLEKTPSMGYQQYAEKIWFEVNANHTSADLVVKTADARKTGSVWLEKRDDKGEVVKGATYGLFDNSGVKLYVTDLGGGKYKYSADKSGTTDMITSAEGVIEIEGLHWGDYYLQETASPKGYDLNPDQYAFTVDKDTVMTTIIKHAVDNRQKGTVELTKCDETNESVLLEGAVFTLYNNDGTIYRDDLTTDANGKLKVENIDWGSYYFLEKTAPAGYGLNPQKVRFSVNYLTAGKVQEITVTDPQKNYKLTINKKILQSDVVLAHGNPTFTFEVKNTASGRTYYKTVAFSSDNLVPGAEGYAEASIVYALPMGTYEISEVSVDRYALSKIEAGEGAKVEGDKAVVTLNDSNPEGGVTVSFTNDKTDQSKTTDNSTVTNILNRARKLTAIVADYHGPATVTTETIPPGDLTVYAVYDDGTQITVVNYTLDPETLSCENNGDFDISVSYTDGGITRKDSFTVNVDLPNPFTAQFVSKQADGTYENANEPTPFTDTDGTTYDGLVKITGYIGTSSVVNFPATLTGYIPTGSETEDPQYVGKKFKVVEIGNTTNIPIKGIYGKTTITFAEGIEGIRNKAFQNNATLNCELVLPNSLRYIGDKAFESCSQLHGALVIPDSVETIGSEAFHNCGDLDGTLELSNNLTTIGEGAFNNCRKLKGDLNIPDTVETIGNRAFLYCSGFDGALHLPENPEFTTIEENTFYDCSKLTGDLVIPKNVTTIKFGAFYNCHNLTGGLDLSNVTTIGTFSGNEKGAFENCYSLNGELKLSDNLTSIGRNAFYNCRNLTSNGVYIPDTVEILGERAFANCNKLSGELHLSGNSNLTAIGMNTFYNCGGLSGILTIPGNIKKLGYGAFYECDGFTGLVLSEGLEEISVSINGENYDSIWGAPIGTFSFSNGFDGNLSLPSTVKTIGKSSFRGCTGFDNALVIPVKVTAIERNAFHGCTGLNTVELNQGLNSIGEEAFKECTGLACDLTIPTSVTSIGANAFADCQKLKGYVLTIPKGNSLTSIGVNAFANCKFDSELDGGMNSQIWIPIDMNNASDQAKGVETDKLYRYGEGTAGNVDQGAMNTSQLTVGNDVFWGYQVKYGYFQRSN